MNDWLYRISPCLRIVGNAPTQPGWVEAMRYIYEHELVFFDGTDYVLEIGTEKYECPAGSFIIVPPGLRHISRAMSNRSGHRYWIHFDWSYCGEASQLPVMTYCPARPREDLFRHAPDFIPVEILRGQIRNWNGALEMFRRIENLFNQGDGREKAVSRGVFLELLLELLCPESEVRTEESTASRLASRIRRQLHEFSDQPLRDAMPIREYLEKSGLSYAHQCRIFKQAYGISPLQYVNELRMIRIKNLLQDTSLCISEIADLAGYDNLGYFSRMFKNYTHLSPTAYRQSVLGPSGV